MDRAATLLMWWTMASKGARERRDAWSAGFYARIFPAAEIDKRDSDERARAGRAIAQRPRVTDFLNQTRGFSSPLCNRRWSEKMRERDSANELQREGKLGEMQCQKL